MADPQFDQVNLVVRDMDETLAFYRKVGLGVPDAGDVGLMSPIDADRKFVPPL